MEDKTIKRIKIIKRPRKVKLILHKLDKSKKKSKNIKTIIIKPHRVMKGDHKYNWIKKKDKCEKDKRYYGGKKRKIIKKKIIKKKKTLKQKKKKLNKKKKKNSKNK